MKLTKQHSLDEFGVALRNAAMQNAADADCPGSYAGAFGGIQALLYAICQKHPKTLALVNEYIARYEVKTAESAQPAATPAMAAEIPEALPPEVAAMLEFPLMPKEEFEARLQSLQKTLLDAPSEAGPNGTLEGWTAETPVAAPAQSSGSVPPSPDHSTLPASASPSLPQNGSSAQSAAAASQPHTPKESSHSSAQSGKASGDINCNGQCDDRPPLVILIDQCGSVMNARRKLCNATPAALRAAARYLRTDMHSLPAEIIRRVRARLLKNI